MISQSSVVVSLSFHLPRRWWSKLTWRGETRRWSTKARRRSSPWRWETRRWHARHTRWCSHGRRRSSVCHWTPCHCRRHCSRWCSQTHSSSCRHSSSRTWLHLQFKLNEKTKRYCQYSRSFVSYTRVHMNMIWYSLKPVEFDHLEVDLLHSD